MVRESYRGVRGGSELSVGSAGSLEETMIMIQEKWNGRVHHIPDTANSISRFEGGGYPMACLVLWRVCDNLQGSQACRSGPDNTDRFTIRVGIVRQRHWQEELGTPIGMHRY